MELIGVYLIICEANGKRYVGASRRLERRDKQHAYQLNRGTHNNPRLQEAWSAYGPSSFYYVQIENCCESILTKREQFWIDLLSPEFNCMVVLLPRKRPSAETQAKMAAAIRERASKILHCPKGHPYNAENTHKNKKGKRICRRCAADREAVKRAAFTEADQQAVKDYKQNWFQENRARLMPKMQARQAAHKEEKREYDRLRKLRLKLLRSQ